jgi:hypothetical protein
MECARLGREHLEAKGGVESLTRLSISLTCLPDTVDPRGPKATGR